MIQRRHLWHIARRHERIWGCKPPSHKSPCSPCHTNSHFDAPESPPGLEGCVKKDWRLCLADWRNGCLAPCETYLADL